VGSLRGQVHPRRPRQALERIGDPYRTVLSVIPLDPIGEKVLLGRGREMVPCAFRLLDPAVECLDVERLWG